MRGLGMIRETKIGLAAIARAFGHIFERVRTV
jgi:hypothetical protein